MATVFRSISWLTLLALIGCVSTPATPQRSPGSAPDALAASGPAKILTIGQPEPKKGFAPWFIMGSGRALQWEELHSNFLVTTDGQGSVVARLAAQLPSFDDGTITLLPDGRMRSVWKLRPNVKWHDGRTFTAEDVVFGWQVAGHPEIPVSLSPTFRAIESIEASDPITAVITYKTTFYKALELGFRDLYPLPQHLLADAFQGDKDAFTKLPIWAKEYVHTGPFRVTQFEPGENVVYERFDDYFLGRPKLNVVVIRIIQDDNAMLSNLLSGVVDLAGELPTDLVANVRDSWQQSGVGYVLSQQGNWRFISIQFHPEWGGPPALHTDVRIRRGLAFGYDRDSIRSVVVRGFPDTEGDTFMVRADPRAPLVGAPYARYRYDPKKSAQELAAAGWRRGPDGRMLSEAGQQVQLNLRTTGAYETELAAVAGNWRELGIDATEEVMSRVMARDNEYIAKFPSMEITAQGNGDGILRRFDSRLQPLTHNRYVGSNGGHYANPALDALIDRFYSTIGDREQGILLGEMGEILAADLPALPMYFSINTVAALKHVRGLDAFVGAVRVGTTARDAYLLDRD